ncbi:MAG: hypothetical protein AB7P02_16650 [Alphaproteobacteria bacterium]
MPVHPPDDSASGAVARRARFEDHPLVPPSRPWLSADDLQFVAMAPRLFAAALRPEGTWPAAAARIQARGPHSAGVSAYEAAASRLGVAPEVLADWIERGRVGRTEHLIHGMAALLRRSWTPSVTVDGRSHLDAALAGGRGAVLWVAHFCFSSLFSKMGLAAAGYRVVHVSRPEHGVSKSRIGVAILNRARAHAEDRFLDRRIVHDRSDPAATAARVSEVLRGNGIVSITVGAWEGRRIVRGPLLGGEFLVARGAPALAASNGAALLPVFTVRDPAGGYRVTIGAPLGAAAPRPRDFVLVAVEDLLDAHEPAIRAAPDQWRGWKDWMKQSKLRNG